MASVNSLLNLVLTLATLSPPILSLTPGAHLSAALPPRPLVIAHRGSSGTHPEHTIGGYFQAIDDGADYIECDVTLSRDLVPVCIHENSLSRTTDVESKFPDRRRNLTIPGVGTLYDWFAIDFTLDELKRLRKKQAYEFRDKSFNYIYDIPTLAEFLRLSTESSKVLGVYPEIKDPAWLNALPMMNGSRFEDIVLALLHSHGFTDEKSPCIIQSFDERSLEYLSSKTSIRLAMLIQVDASNDDLDKWKSLGFDGIGVWTAAISKHHNAINGYKNWINGTTDLVERAHARGLVVHVWTMRNEDMYLAWDFQQDIYRFVDHFLGLGVDGIFTDFPGTLSRYLNLLYGENKVANSGVRTNGSIVATVLGFIIALKGAVVFNVRPHN